MKNVKNTHVVLYDLVAREFGPTSENYALLASYDWAGHDRSVCAVLPVMPGFTLRVSLVDANRARRENGIRYDGDEEDAAKEAAHEAELLARRVRRYEEWYGAGSYAEDSNTEQGLKAL